MQFLTRFETLHFLFGYGEAKNISAVVNSLMHHNILNAGRIVYLDTVQMRTARSRLLVGGKISIFE